MVLKNKVSLVSLHQWTYGPLMIIIKKSLLISTLLILVSNLIVSTLLAQIDLYQLA